MRLLVITGAFAVAFTAQASAQYMGNWSANPMLPPALPAPPGTFTNPMGTNNNSPKLYDQSGQFRGNLNSNPFDQNSVANPFGRYGSPFSSDSVTNPMGRYGSPFSADSPRNPFGQGLSIYGPD